MVAYSTFLDLSAVERRSESFIYSTLPAESNEQASWSLRFFGSRSSRWRFDVSRA